MRIQEDSPSVRDKLARKFALKLAKKFRPLLNSNSGSDFCLNLNLNLSLFLGRSPPRLLPWGQGRVEARDCE